MSADRLWAGLWIQCCRLTETWSPTQTAWPMDGTFVSDRVVSPRRNYALTLRTEDIY